MGILSQPGGFFLHLWQGQPGERSVGTLVTAVGAVLIAAALITLAVGRGRLVGAPGAEPA